MTRPSGRGKKGEVISKQSIDDMLLATKRRQNVSMVVYQDSPLLVEASRLTFFKGEPDIGGQFRIRMGARDSFVSVTAKHIWGPCDNEKGNHVAFANEKGSHLR